VSKDSQRITHSLYESAGEMLLDKIAEVNTILIKQKAKTGETESYRFWIRVADVMKFAWDYIHDVQWILRKNQILEAENKWLKDWNIELSKRLEYYELVREMKLNGRFEEIVKSVDVMLSKREQQSNPVKQTLPDE
jgi:phage-related minor tail protein